jgi:ABC-type branched-subunit amino acid transport system ATPase component
MNQREPAPPLGRRTILTLKTLRKSFGSLQVIDDLDLEVEGGEALGIIGPNGAGKSTLFNLIAGLLKPEAGTIEFRRDRSRLPDPAPVRKPDRVRKSAGGCHPWTTQSRKAGC